VVIAVLPKPVPSFGKGWSLYIKFSVLPPLRTTISLITSIYNRLIRGKIGLRRSAIRAATWSPAVIFGGTISVRAPASKPNMGALSSTILSTILKFATYHPVKALPPRTSPAMSFSLLAFVNAGGFNFPALAWFIALQSL
jgi:hypothetical protein